LFWNNIFDDDFKKTPQLYPLWKAQLVTSLYLALALTNLIADLEVSIYEQLYTSALSIIVEPSLIAISPKVLISTVSLVTI